MPRLALPLLLLAAVGAAAQPATRLAAEGLAPDARFGAAFSGVSLSVCPTAPPGESVTCLTDNALAVGAPGAGSVTVFYDDGSPRTVSLPNPSPQPGDRFGAAVAGGSNSVTVAAPGTQTVTVFDVEGLLSGDTSPPTWALADPTPASTGTFGASVFEGEGYTIVGEPGGGGALHLFDAICQPVGQPAFSASLVPSVASDRDFGSAVRTTRTQTGAILVLSATSDSGGGVVYVYAVDSRRQTRSRGCPLADPAVTLLGRIEGPTGFGREALLNNIQFSVLEDVDRLLIVDPTGTGRVEIREYDGGAWTLVGEFAPPPSGSPRFFRLSAGTLYERVAVITPGVEGAPIREYQFTGPQDEYLPVEYAAPVPTDASFGVTVGTSAYLERPTLTVGAPDEGSGAVYVYPKRSNAAVAVAAADGPMAVGFDVGLLVPNPSAGVVRFAVSSERAQTVRVTLHDALGREVASAVHAVPGGTSEIQAEWPVPPGLYVVRLEAETGVQTRTVSVVR